MEKPTVLSNRACVKKSFYERECLIGAYIGGPILNTVFLTLNAKWLKAGRIKTLVILFTGLIFTAIYIYLFTLHHFLAETAFMVAGGVLLYYLYSVLCKREKSVYAVLYIYGDNPKTTYDLYYLGFVIHILLYFLIGR